MAPDVKQCVTCKQAVPLTQFSKNKNAKDGLQDRCKACVSAYMRARHAANRDRLIQRAREDYRKHREARLAQQKEYCRENAEVIRERQRRCYLAKREERLAKNKEYRDRPENKVKQAERNRLRYLEQREQRLAEAKAYRSTDRGKAVMAKAHQKQRAINGHKIRARTAVGNAVRDGRLTKAAACQQCGTSAPVESHHHNGYEREHWLDVVWLCIPCHKAADKKQEEAHNA